MQLIIAEKPSLGRNIAAGIESAAHIKMQKRKGFLEGGDYLVTWAFGHLFSLADLDYYAPNPDGSDRWTMQTLPCFPEKYVFELKHEKGKPPEPSVCEQFEIIRALCQREDVSAIINAGDADREGEIIVRLCIEKAQATHKPQYRLWLPDQTPQTIAAALSDLRGAQEYRSLANEGYARTIIDWLYGVNLTRYATLKTGTLLRVGRVIVPIVRAIYERDMAIRHFTPQIYYAPVSKTVQQGVPLELLSKKKFQKEQLEDCQALCAFYNAAGGVVSSVRHKKDVLQPGKLYSLTKLQNVLGKKYKMPMDQSLAALQKLYEAGYVTYPRTNSEYLATAEKDKIKQILGGVKALGYPVIFKDKKSIFDDSKIEAHSALTPTYKIPKPQALQETERKVYAEIMHRFVAVFCEQECRVDKTEILIDVAKGAASASPDGKLSAEQFVLKGTVILEKGWTQYDDTAIKDRLLPPLVSGQKIDVAFSPAEKQTTPPKHYTIETLNNYLKNPFREEKSALLEGDGEGKRNSDEEDYRAMFEGLELGTEATRTGIIENARKSGYIQLKKDVYTILDGGIFLVESLDRMGIRMDKFKTSEMGRALKAVYHDKLTVKGAIGLAQEKIVEVFPIPNPDPSQDTDDGVVGQVVGSCPICGRDVVRGRYGYGCSGYKQGCTFRFGNYICGRTVPVSAAKALLSDGTTSVLVGFVSKNGKRFDAALQLRDNHVCFAFLDKFETKSR